MSKFIAMLCAAAMLMSTATVALADDTSVESDGSEFIEEPNYEEEYQRQEGSDFNGTLPGNIDYEDPYYPDDVYTGTSSEIQVIELTSDKDKKEAEDAEEEPAATTGAVFTDVPEDAYYAAAVKFCYERGLFNGMTDTEFAPDVTMTRGMFATVFGRIQNADLTNVTLTYEDVKADAYYASYIAWATTAGIMDGYSEKAFGPDDAITREQAAKMLHAYLGNVKNINITDVAANYADIDTVSDWAKAAVNANTSVGYLRADENNNINPTAELTRADACFAVATTIKLVEALEAEGLKDAGENNADEEAVEIKDADDEITPIESSKTEDDTHAQMSEIPEADKDQVAEDFQPYPGTEYNPIDEEF